LSIELMLVLTVMAIFGGISLYVGKRVVDRAKMVAMEAEAQMFIMKLLEILRHEGRVADCNG
jgi:type II secretory pathway pseudopilin PulG